MNAAYTVNLRGPALIFGGNYSNLEGTRGVLAEAKRRDIGPDHVICTGDVVAYCADPLATVEVMRRWGAHVVMGNCEESLGQQADACSCGFEPGSACELLAEEWYAFAGRMLDEDARAWMRELPRRIDLQVAGRRLAVVHGSVGSINRFIFASTPAEVKRDEMELANCDGVIAGHSGIPFTQIVAGRLWHNPGAIGMPANDGTPRTWYSTMTPIDGGLRVEMHSLDYEFGVTAKKMLQVGLSRRYAFGLQNGLWPSCEVLPAVERAQRGKPLSPVAVHWTF